MWLQFFLENFHFAVNLFAALTFFAIFWLYFDAWLTHKSLKETLKIAGFLLVSLSFVVSATLLESSVLNSPTLDNQINSLLVAISRIPGFILIILSEVLDPIQEKPTTSGLKMAGDKIGGFWVLPVAIANVLLFFYPVLALATGITYFIRATVGYENHLKKVALGFFILSLSSLLGVAAIFRNSTNVNIFNLVRPFGPLWTCEVVLLLIASIILGRWVLGYLLKRLQSQLFMVFSMVTLVIFLLTTISFTFLLLNSIQKDNLRKLETDVKVLNFAISSKQAETLSDAQVAAQNPVVINSLLAGDKSSLGVFSQNFLLTKKQSSLLITNENGQVVARGEDQSRVGESVSGDSLIKRALLGTSGSSVSTKSGVLAPQVFVRAAVPVKSGGKIIGVVVASQILDNAFVDGVKGATGLETAIYGDNQVSATTFVNADGKTRTIGFKENNKRIKDTVLVKGKSFTGSINLLNIPYFAAYLPLKDIDNIPVGMLFVGNKQAGLLTTAGEAIELTFVTAVILLIISIIPAFLVSKYLANQLR